MACMQLDINFAHAATLSAKALGSETPISRISEIGLPANSMIQRDVLLPMLSHLSRANDHRWLTWVGTHHLKKSQCEQVGLDWHRLLQVMTRPNSLDALNVARKAAATGTSHAVVLLTEQRLSNEQMNQLEISANQGNSQILVVYLR
jgi:cell division inhibitor SulA